MEDNIKVLEDEPVEVKQGSGSLLAATRKQQNRSIEDIAKELNLSVTQIKTIELDQTEGLPEPTYVRGYIRGYAKLLGMDADEVLKSYLHPNWQKSTNLTDIPAGIGNAETMGENKGGTKRLLTISLILLLIFLAWYSGLVSNIFGGAENASTRPVASTIISLDSEQQAVGSPIDVQSSVENIETSGDTELSSSEPVANSNNIVEAEQNGVFDPAVAEPALASTSASVLASTPVSELQENTLRMTFNSSSWVDVRDEDDQRLAYQTYIKGEELLLSSEQQFRVFVGNASAVEVEFNGQNFDLSPYTEGLYAKFLLGN